jgi:putative photosynthetic complex assembly protein
MKSGEKLILPLWFRVGIVLMISATLLVAFNHSASERANAIEPIVDHGRAIETQTLHFVDLDGGRVSVVDASDNREITQLAIGEDGFMRSVMRGLARERKANGLGPEIPFELTVWEDGLVSLIDPATQRRVELSAFGKDNVSAFTRLLPGAVHAPANAELSRQSSS